MMVYVAMRQWVSAGVCLLAVMSSPALGACLPPERPYLPADPVDARLYADLIRADVETYITAIQQYFRCLDAERSRAFAEARQVSEDYGRFIILVAGQVP